MIPRCFPQNSSGYMKVYPVSSSGKTRWRDYVPVRDMGGTAASPNTCTIDGGHYKVEVLSSITGLKEWIDYIPVVFVDPYYASVVTQLRLDGADAGTTFTDEAGLTWSATANAQLDTAQKVFGTASLLCDGTGDYISCANTTAHDFGAGDFTIEGWVRYSVVGTPGSRWVSKWTTAGTLESWKIGYVFSGNLLTFSYTTNGTTDVNVSGAFTPVAGTWYHFAVSRVGNNLKTFIDGAVIGTADVTGVTIYTANTVTRIGRGDTASDHNGWLDEIRITKGVGRYSAAFTAPTYPLPDLIANSSASYGEANDDGYVPVWTP